MKKNRSAVLFINKFTTFTQVLFRLKIYLKACYKGSHDSRFKRLLTNIKYQKRLYLQSIALLCLWSQQAYCDSVSEALQQKLNSIKTMSAYFSQVIEAKKREISHSSGTMALSRPGRFRWQTKKPMEQLVIADGQRLWVYDVDLEQVSVKKQQKGVGGTVALFISGYGDTVTRDYNVTSYTKNNKAYFDLQAKSGKENFQHIKLIFDANTLKGIELFDQLGQHTVVTLTQVKNNVNLAPALFQFKVPKGVDVVNQ